MKRRDTIALSASIIGGGAVAGWLASDSEVIQNQEQLNRNQTQEIANTTNDNLQDLDVTQTDFDSAQEYAENVTSAAAQSLDEMNEIVEEELGKSAHLDSSDDSLDVLDEVGNRDQYVVSDHVRDEEQAIVNTTQMPDEGTEITNITDLGAELPESFSDVVESLSEVTTEGAPSRFEGGSETLNLAVKHGEVPVQDHLLDMADTYDTIADRLEGAYDEQTVSEVSDLTQDRINEMDHEEESAHRELLQQTQATVEGVDNYRGQKVEEYRSAADFFETIAEANGHNLNVDWGEAGYSNQWDEDLVGVSAEQYAEDQGFEDPDRLSLVEDPDGDYSVVYDGEDTGTDLTAS